MRKITEDAFYGLNKINYKEIFETIKVLHNKSLFRYDGVNMLYETDKLEEELKKYFNQEVLCVNNGTSALKLCLLANNIGYGDEVIVPCLSFIATASSCLSVGAIPIFCEIDETFTIDPQDIEQKITKKTKAIVVVHYQGYSCNMDKIKQIAKRYKLILIEDVAQAFGAKYNNKLLGTFGDSAAFSFQSCKIITCGEGGAITSKKNMDFIKRYVDNGGHREKDMMPVWDKEYCTYGENFKMTDLQSAILIKQFKKIKKIIKNQEKIYETIIKNIKGYNLRKCLNEKYSIKMSLCVMFNNQKECDIFIKEMLKYNIPFSKKTSNFLPDYNVFKYGKTFSKNNFPFNDKYKVNSCEKSRDLIERTAWLVLNSKNKKSDCKYIFKIMRKFKDEQLY